MPVPFTGLLQFVLGPPLLLPLLLVLPLLLLVVPPSAGVAGLELELHPAHAATVTATKPVPKSPIREEFILLLQIV